MRFIYIIKNLLNGKVYIGQTNDAANRKANHFYNAKSGRGPLYAAIRKYGRENFLFEVIEECEDNLCNAREEYWVGVYDSFNPASGYNLTSGGRQNFVVSEETKSKIGSFWRGRQQTEEHIAHRVESFKHNGKKKGQTPPNKGLPMTDELRKTISEKLKGRPANAGSFKKGVPSPKKGKPGKPHTEETRRKISESHKRRKQSDDSLREEKEV